MQHPFNFSESTHPTIPQFVEMIDSNEIEGKIVRIIWNPSTDAMIPYGDRDYSERYSKGVIKHGGWGPDCRSLDIYVERRYRNTFEPGYYLHCYTVTETDIKSVRISVVDGKITINDFGLVVTHENLLVAYISDLDRDIFQGMLENQNPLLQPPDELYWINQDSKSTHRGVSISFWALAVLGITYLIRNPMHDRIIIGLAFLFTVNLISVIASHVVSNRTMIRTLAHKDQMRRYASVFKTTLHKD